MGLWERIVSVSLLLCNNLLKPVDTEVIKSNIFKAQKNKTLGVFAPHHKMPKKECDKTNIPPHLPFRELSTVDRYGT